MTPSQTLQIEQSELRERINVLGAKPAADRSEAETRELTEKRARAVAIEPELRTAISAEATAADAASAAAAAGGGDAETRERIALRDRVSFGGWLASQLGAGGAAVDAGALAEYRTALGVEMQPGIPLDIFEAGRPPETRAVTPAPTTGTGVVVAPVQPFVFAESIAPALGIEIPSVPSGGYSEMRISTALQPAPEPKGDAADGTAAALASVTANPRRISARLSLALEDIAQVGQANFEAALRAHTAMALSHALDNQIINGNGTSPNINGLIAQLAAPTTPTAVSAFDDFVAAFADQLDGLWASKPSEVSLVANVAAYKLSAKTFRDGSGGQSRAGDVSFSDYARIHYGGWWTNSRMPATASTIARAIVFRMGRMGIRTACLPTWGTVSIDDIYTDSASGLRHFSIHILVGDKVLIVQPGAYDLAEYKVS